MDPKPSILQGGTVQDFQALHAPIAPLSWSLEAVLPANVQGTGDIPIRWTRPVEILGMKATVLPVYPFDPDGGTPAPILEDVDVYLLTEDTSIWTKHYNESGGDGNFVPLAHLTVDTPRLLRICLWDDAPDLTFQFQWAQFLQGTPFTVDALIRLTLFTRYLDKIERQGEPK